VGDEVTADVSVAGRVWRGRSLQPAVLHIDRASGMITKVAKSARLADHHDFGDRAILPAATDLHVHFREPGLTHKEDLRTGSTSAAFGGVTAFLDMPNTAPPTTTLKALREKLHLAAQKSVVDFGVWCGASWFQDDLPTMLRHSPGLKVYLGATTGDLLMDDAERTRDALRAAGAAGKVVVVHAEAQRVLEQFRGAPATLAEYDRSRPPVAEVECIYDLMKLLAGMRKPPRVHVAHAASAEAVAAAKAAGFSIGVCPHHILLDTEACPGDPARGKMNPPLRGAGQRAALWRLFADGSVPILESDHAPHTQAEKTAPLHQAPAGVPGVETMVPLLLARVVAGDVDLARVVAAACENPAKLVGLQARGTLAKGSRADFMVVDLGATGAGAAATASKAARATKAARAAVDARAVVKIEPGRLHSRCTWTPFADMDAVFPSDVWSHGSPVVTDRVLVAEPGAGRPLWPLPED
jgi:dihydroorotase